MPRLEPVTIAVRLCDMVVLWVRYSDGRKGRLAGIVL
jgi:hypothetical protein